MIKVNLIRPYLYYCMNVRKYMYIGGELSLLKTIFISKFYVFITIYFNKKSTLWIIVYMLYSIQSPRKIINTMSMSYDHFAGGHLTPCSPTLEIG